MAMKLALISCIYHHAATSDIMQRDTNLFIYLLLQKINKFTGMNN